MTCAGLRNGHSGVTGATQITSSEVIGDCDAQMRDRDWNITPIVRFVASVQMDARTRTVAGQEVPQLEAWSLKALMMQRERNRGELQRQVKQLTCSCNLGLICILGRV